MFGIFVRYCRYKAKISGQRKRFAALKPKKGKRSLSCIRIDTGSATAHLSSQFGSISKAGMANSAPLYRRRWAESSKKKEGVDLRVVQFNVLADGLSGRDTKLGGFDSAPKDSLKWEARRERLIEELFRHGPEPDVICLEEVDHFDDWFMPQLSKRGYRGFFLKKPKSPCLKTAPGSGLEDGCALFCREATVSVVCVETMNYAASNQVALLATVRVTGSSSFVVACTHLVARKTAEGEAQRKKQVCELMERLDTMGLPCVICLDMNAAPHDAS